jgi:excisionase family DNA binding protein
MSEHSTAITTAKGIAHSTDRLVLTVEEAAERLGIGRTMMYALITAGEVESVRIGRLRRVPTDALGTFVLRLRESPHGPRAA